MKKRSAKKTRRISAVVCVLCMLLALYIGTLTVYAQSTAKIIMSSCTAEKGGTATVSFELAENPGIWGLKFKVGYNHDLMTLQSVKIGDVFAENEVTLPESLDKEKFVFYASANEINNVSENGKLVTLSFAISSEAALADCDVIVDVIQAINVDGKNINVSVESGKTSGSTDAPDTSDKLFIPMLTAIMMLLISAASFEVLLFRNSNKGRSDHNV